MARFDQVIEMMTLGDMRELGVRSLAIPFAFGVPPEVRPTPG
jgi:hypothetical protein